MSVSPGANFVSRPCAVASSHLRVKTLLNALLTTCYDYSTDKKRENFTVFFRADFLEKIKIESFRGSGLRFESFS
jgi:hypothetical protein